MLQLDPEDRARFAGVSLRLDKHGYFIFGNGVFVHRNVMMAAGHTIDGKVIDHINHDLADNRKSNLRVCTQGENLANGSSHKDSESKYRGVSRVKATGKWRAQICKNYRVYQIGQYDSERDAAIAYDAVSTFLNGEYAGVNNAHKDK